jgi:hypothetical protein
MRPFNSLTDAEGRSVADHVERLKRTLDGLAGRLRDAVAAAVGEAVSGAVEAAVRAALVDLVGNGAVHVEPRSRRYGSSYWGDPYDEWSNRPHDPYGSSSGRDESDYEAANEPDAKNRRWPLLAFLGGRLLSALSRRLPADHRWLSMAGLALAAALTAAAGVPAAGLGGSALGLACLATVVGGGTGMVSSFTT